MQTPSSARGSFSQLATRLSTALSLLLTAWLLYWGWRQRDSLYLSPENGAGYVLGIVGASLMLLLLLYPLRKQLRLMRNWGAVRYWFRMHMVFGIAGPLAILYHCNFHLGATNSNVALWAMLIVAGSGLVGRFFYAVIHQGLYGRRLTLEELRRDWEQTRREMRGGDADLAGIEQLLERYEAPLLGPYRGTLQAAGLLLGNGWRRWLVRRRVRRLLGSAVGGVPDASAMAQLLNDRLAAATTLYRFNACERLFALWHLLHMPLFIMLVITGIIHVVAVHLY